MSGRLVVAAVESKLVVGNLIWAKTIEPYLQIQSQPEFEVLGRAESEVRGQAVFSARDELYCRVLVKALHPIPFYSIK